MNIIMMIIMIIFWYPARCTHMRFDLRRSKSGDYIIYIAQKLSIILHLANSLSLLIHYLRSSTVTVCVKW